MVLERGESGDGLASELESRHAIGDALLGVGTIAMMVSRSWASVDRFGSSRASR
jgi:hypothetical protein